ncbi:thioesterase [Nocardioides sp. Root79]|nr:thioesterase [Nocardioides sp. Root79]KRC72800.1 thioesterase [Nocardioides sp. Root240]
MLRHRVRYHEADAQGFLFNGRYLEIADVAMTEFFRYLGFDYSDMVARGMDPSVVQVNMTLEKPAHFDDLLDVDVVCARVGRTSFTLDTIVSRDGVRLARLTLIYVNVEATTETARALPTDIDEALRAAVTAASP